MLGAAYSRPAMTRCVERVMRDWMMHEEPSSYAAAVHAQARALKPQSAFARKSAPPEGARGGRVAAAAAVSARIVHGRGAVIAPPLQTLAEHSPRTGPVQSPHSPRNSPR